MRRQLGGAAPNAIELFLNRFRDYIAYVAVGLLIIAVLGMFAITYSLKRDCTNIDKRNLEVGGFWVHWEMGKLDEGCPAPYHV